MREDVHIHGVVGPGNGARSQRQRIGFGTHGVEALQHDHRQDHVAVLAAYVEVAQHVVGDSPKEVGDPVDVLVVAHVT